MVPDIWRLIVVHRMPSLDHALMKNPGNEHAGSVLPVEHNMSAVFHAAQAGANVLT